MTPGAGPAPDPSWEERVVGGVWEEPGRARRG